MDVSKYYIQARRQMTTSYIHDKTNVFPGFQIERQRSDCRSRLHVEKRSITNLLTTKITEKNGKKSKVDNNNKTTR